jgi:hypothetical protein
MHWKQSIKESGINFRKFRRPIVMLTSSATIIWLGSSAISHISELYDGLCPDVQGPGLAVLLYDGNRLGYCTGIGDYLSGLGFIMGLAAFSVPCALTGWWYYRDRINGKKSE